MHNFYENRLVRCYLGASRLKRYPNRFTGFDPDDDVRVADLSPMPGKSGEPGYAGPYPLLNAALNLVSGEELAWRQRKAESFVFTPLFCGFSVTPTVEKAGGPKADRGRSIFAFRPTRQYAFPRGGIRLGRAMAISGAAANNTSKYVYLSDGGHFENLGIYELVRRPCRYIIACDGGQDAGFSFEDLGNAIRKCRADHGVEIEIDLNSIRPAAADSDAKPRSKAHCAVGIIHYPDAPRAFLVYIKASLTGDEPADVQEYAAFHPEFPHQSTADQFFDESQFESYRRLGLHIGDSVFGEIVKRRETLRRQGALRIDADRAGFFSEVRWRWYAASPKTGASFTRHAEALTKLMRTLSTDPKLAFLNAQISPEWERLMQSAGDKLEPSGLGLPFKADERQAGFYFCNALMQLMEDVYLDLNLEEENDHPDNSGWMNLFRHWAWSAMFRATWVISASCYGARFRSFCENELDLDLATTGQVKIVPANYNSAQLNYRAKEMLAAAGFEHHGQKLYLAHTAAGELAYLRVQEHLRDMGLARRILDAMVVEGQCLVSRKALWHELPVGFPEPVTPENKERIERLLESAHMRRAGIS